MLSILIYFGFYLSTKIHKEDSFYKLVKYITRKKCSLTNILNNINRLGPNEHFTLNKNKTEKIWIVLKFFVYLLNKEKLINLETKKGIAFEKEVFERASKILKEKYGKEMTEEDMEETFEILISYIKNRMREKPYLSLRLPKLGRIYYPYPTCSKRSNQRKHAVTGNKENNLKASRIWRERYEMIDEAYQNNQPTVNASKTYRLLHVIAPFLKKAKLRGYEIEEIEELQNKIE